MLFTINDKDTAVIRTAFLIGLITLEQSLIKATEQVESETFTAVHKQDTITTLQNLHNKLNMYLNKLDKQDKDPSKRAYLNLKQPEQTSQDIQEETKRLEQEGESDADLKGDKDSINHP